ncbi:oligosaccharide flippase family protein [Globicatella sulfidifaciens]|uniref:Oligosaccharide flippase family protein n=1 Tax=Globicatella sulfidifaciens TaxID=136093 RepID=A0A7X8C3F4_9LACT|nr:oligosaccharide flippase family protein [Globicatella sulfidifaciens]NLJ18275.1 oligosaccharide flippase family protein [Globicatella sulfidifaciens]
MIKLISFIKVRRNFIGYLLLRILNMALGFITNVFIIRQLSVNDYGVFSIALMLIGLFTTFGFSWSSSSILYFGSREKAKTGNLNKTFWSRNIIIAISLLIMTILFGLFRNQINNYIGLEVALLVLIWLYISVAEDYLVQYFLAVKKQLLSSLLSFTAKSIYLTMIIIFSFDVKTLILINIISHATVLLYIIKINKSDIGKFEFDKSWFKKIFNFSIWQLFGFSGLYLINFGDTFVINHFMTTEDVGIYNAAYKLFDPIGNFSFVISSYYASSITQNFINKSSGKIRQFFYKERFLILLLSTLGHIVVMALARPLIVTFFGVEYTDSVVIFQILMVGSIFKYASVFYMLYFNANGKHRLQQFINIFRAIFNVVLNVILIKQFGLIGVAVGTTLSIIVTLLISAIYSEKKVLELSKETP